MKIMEDASNLIIINFVAYPAYNLKVKVYLTWQNLTKFLGKQNTPKPQMGKEKVLQCLKSNAVQK